MPLLTRSNTIRVQNENLQSKQTLKHSNSTPTQFKKSFHVCIGKNKINLTKILSLLLSDTIFITP